MDISSVLLMNLSQLVSSCCVAQGSHPPHCYWNNFQCLIGKDCELKMSGMPPVVEVLVISLFCGLWFVDEMEASQSTIILDEEEEENRAGIVNMDSIQRVISMSQHFSATPLSQQSGIVRREIRTPTCLTASVNVLQPISSPDSDCIEHILFYSKTNSLYSDTPQQHVIIIKYQHNIWLQ